MTYFFTFSAEAKENLQELKNDKGLKKRYKAVKKTLYFLKENPKHPSLQTHPYESLSREIGKKTFEAYAEQNTPAAYRIFFYYGSRKNEIVIVAITPHP
jgi:mRNA-degrading endonuclease RelE of RelBE toxin-antitoxin system